MVDLEKRYKDHSAKRNLRAAAQFADHEFVGEADENSVQVFVGYSSDLKHCVFKIDDIYLSAAELRDTAFIQLDDIVRRAGGVGILTPRDDGIVVPEARNQADADTPWSCVGVATYQVQIVGWPRVRFEIIDYDN